MNDDSIACVGLGYVGLYTAIAFCEAGYQVTGIDIDQEVVDRVNDGSPPKSSDEFDNTIQKHVQSGRLTATTSAKGINANRFIISVPTPITDRNEPDLSYIQAAASEVADVLKKNELVIIQSTLPPGSTRQDVLPVLEQSDLQCGDDFGLAYVPERYSPGQAVSKSAPRVVGAINPEWRDLTAELYRAITDDVVVVDSLEIAEATKMIENVQRDVNIALVNEVAQILDGIGIDIQQVLDAAETKWNFHRYDPGLGVGGHCIPVDPYYLMHCGRNVGLEPALPQVARDINDAMPRFHFKKLTAAIHETNKNLSDSTTAVFGITYKPGIKDIRNSSALDLIEYIRQAGGDVQVYDPEFEPGATIGDHETTNQRDPFEAAENADALVVNVNREQVGELSAFTEVMADDPVLLDPNGTCQPGKASRSGFRYIRAGFGPRVADRDAINTVTTIDINASE